MSTNVRKHKNGFRKNNWTVQEVNALITFWKQVSENNMIDESNIISDFIFIQENFTKKFKNSPHVRSLKEIKNKMGNLKRRWREEEVKLKSGRCTSSEWHYFEQMSEIMNLLPEIETSRANVSISKMTASLNAYSESDSDPDHVEPPAKRVPLTAKTVKKEVAAKPARVKRRKKSSTFQGNAQPVAKEALLFPLFNKAKQSLSPPRAEACPTEPPKSTTLNDEFYHYGTYVASALRDLPGESALSLRNKINALFYHENINVRHQANQNGLNAGVLAKVEPPLLSPIGEEPWNKSRRSQDGGFSPMHGSAGDQCRMSNGKIPAADKEDECDMFLKSICTQMRSLPLKDRVELYSDIQIAVAKRRVSYLTSNSCEQ